MTGESAVILVQYLFKLLAQIFVFCVLIRIVAYFVINAAKSIE